MIGTKLGPYEIQEEVGKGGMATVFRAYQPNVDRDVAIKVIQRSIAGDDSAVQRFQREARLIARLEHPHILPVYDFDGAHEPPYIVMRYLDSGTLKEVMQEGLLPHDEVAFLIRQVCSALDYAHRQGIIHRDIKPSNIMIDREGNAFVADLGIARIAAGEGKGSQITETGAIVGTPDYCSPEQAMGSTEIDFRSDIYALGVMFFQMLTGELPYHGPTPMKVLLMHMQDPVPLVSTVNLDLPAVLDGVIATAMAKSPEDRYSSAVEFSNAVTAALGGSVTSSPTRLREVAGTSIIRRIKGSSTGTDSRVTPSEQNKTVTALYANAAEYAAIVDEVAGGEASRRAMHAFWDNSQKLVKDHHGEVFTRSDNDMLALWGSDSAQEDDAENAVLTGLLMQESIRMLGAAFFDAEEDDEPLPLDIGINSGLALLSPSGDTGTYSASGATISLANRLMRSAEGTILITHDTFRQVMGIFDIEEDVPLKVRGRKEPIETYRVIAAKERSFRIQARGVEGVETQMVGRRAEFEQLQKAYLYAVEDEETQFVTVVGDAGVGKSRLLYEFDRWGELRTEKYRVFKGRATQAMTERPYALIRDIVSYRFNILDSDQSAAVRQKLEAGVLDLIGKDDHEMAHMIGHLCGFDLSDSRHIKGLLSDPQQLSNRARQLFIRMITTIASAIEPVVIQIEDIHFADDASLDLLNELFTADEELRMLAVCMARPALYTRRPEWGSGQRFHIRVELKPLDKRDSRDLVREILQRVDSVPKSLRDLLVDRAEGNPYYMEELVKMLIDDRVIVKDSETQWRVEESRMSALNVPSTLLGLLEARVDTLLHTEKLVLQRASVIGRIFYDKALHALDAVDDVRIPDLDDVLEKLIEREFIYRRETTAFEGAIEYIFAGNMLRDAIYNALLRRQLETYNRAAAQWLIDTAGKRAGEYNALIAEYYEKGGDKLNAARTLLIAGRQADAISAYTDARGHFEHALELLPEDAKADRAQAIIDLGDSLIRVGELDEALGHFQNALTLARELDDTNLQANALYQLSQIATLRAQWEDALTHLNESLPLARSGDDRATQARVLYGLADTHFRMNHGQEALDAAEESLKIAREIHDPMLEAMALNRIGAVYAFSEDHQDYDVAMAKFEECIKIAKRVGNRERESGAIANIGVVHAMKQDNEAAAHHTESALTIQREINDIQGMIVSTGNLCDYYTHTGDLARASANLVEAIKLCFKTNATYWQHTNLTNLAQLNIVAGDVDTGLTYLGLYMKLTGDDMRAANVQFALDLLPEKLQESEIEAKMAAGESLDMDTVLNGFLKEQEAAG